jgi:hypothetical protein
MAELPDERNGGAPLAMLIDGMTAEIFYPVEGGLSVLLAYDLAQLASKQTDGLAACRAGCVGRN